MPAHFWYVGRLLSRLNDADVLAYVGFALAIPVNACRHDSTRGHPLDTSLRSCCGLTGSDVGP